MCHRDYAMRPSIDTVITALFAIQDKKQYCAFTPIHSNFIEKATLSESSSRSTQVLTPEYLLARFNKFYDHMPIAERIPYSQRYLLIGERVWRRIMTILDDMDNRTTSMHDDVSFFCFSSSFCSCSCTSSSFSSSSSSSSSLSLSPSSFFSLSYF
jgi:hypothetical protein